MKITVERFNEVTKGLSEEFPVEEIEWKIGPMDQNKETALVFPFVNNRAIQNRLDDVIGSFSWRNEFSTILNGQLCGISIKVYEQDGNFEWITKWDGAENPEISPIKGGLSDAMKRTGVQWGIGRYLYGLDDIWVKIEKRGDSFFIKESEIAKLHAHLKGEKIGENVSSNEDEVVDKVENIVIESIEGAITTAQIGMVNALLTQFKDKSQSVLQMALNKYGVSTLESMPKVSFHEFIMYIKTQLTNVVD
ncbi:MAG: Rad52/Rad22 family DNA repair protein [Tissierellales bacterium]|jgi:hypothetical protein|nr:Rad52/Rad22 family DNA repair protein [Tissierellales bacterium]